jgi:type II restriction/modification system DNA methylase subunit YeeA
MPLWVKKIQKKLMKINSSYIKTENTLFLTLSCFFSGFSMKKKLLENHPILFSGVTSLPLTTTSRPSLGGENPI